MESSFSSSVVGIQRGVDQIQTAAHNLASIEKAEDESRNTVEALTDLERGKQQAQASAKALSAENDVIGSLLSVRA